jgi:predicted nuclease of restriction endonuclease-like RecB superfamily
MVTVAWARRKIWAQENPETYRAGKRRWYRKNARRISENNARRQSERVMANAAYYKKHPEKLHERSLKYNHGITLKEYHTMLEQQNYGCAICSISPDDCSRKKLEVDHDHATDKIRGLLCEHCNRMLGHAKDRHDILEAAARYLVKTGGGNS